MSTSSQNGATKYLVVLSENGELKKKLYEVLKDKRPFVPTYRDKKEVTINYYYYYVLSHITTTVSLTKSVV